MNDRLSLWRATKKSLNFTNQDIATKAQLPLRTVEQIMCGKVKAPRLDTVEAIEEALGLGTPPLQWTEEDKALGAGNHPTYLSEKEWRILNAFNDLERTRGEAFADKMIKMIEDISELPEKK